MKRRRNLRDDLKDLKIKSSNFDGNLNPESKPDWVQSMERSFELKDYNEDKSFKLSILNIKGYAFL